ncbi:type 1 glutamine amidotransferase domain-containing protein [Caballeronia sp. DA-9]|uniref:type 1 glutamine amidotransferase domain-containing protein n=1 Tax=Caballeronia sp. DA-9 TaxID=3436237 RepID=UPI003F678360
MTASLNGYKVAILAVDGFEQAELVEPQKALKAAGAKVDVVSQKPGQIQGFVHTDLGDKANVDITLDKINAADYDALVLPGGVVNGDAIRIDTKAQGIVKQFNTDGKPIAVICHGGWLPISSGIVSGRTMTSWPTLQDDIRNAGGTWVDEEVHRDGNLITSRKPDDIPAFNKAIIEALNERPKAA